MVFLKGFSKGEISFFRELKLWLLARLSYFNILTGSKSDWTPD